MRVEVIVSPTHSPTALIRSQQAAFSPGVTCMKGSNSKVSRRSRVSYIPEWSLLGHIVLNTLHCTALYWRVKLLSWQNCTVVKSLAPTRLGVGESGFYCETHSRSYSPYQWPTFCHQGSPLKTINCTISRRGWKTYHSEWPLVWQCCTRYCTSLHHIIWQFFCECWFLFVTHLIDRLLKICR